MSRDHSSPPGMPLWVKVFWLIGLALVLLFIIANLTGHSPFMHLPPVQLRGQQP